MAVGTELCVHTAGAPLADSAANESPVFAQVPMVGGSAYPGVVRMEAGGITIEISAGADAELAESILRLPPGRW